MIVLAFRNDKFWLCRDGESATCDPPSRKTFNTREEAERECARLIDLLSGGLHVAEIDPPARTNDRGRQ